MSDPADLGYLVRSLPADAKSLCDIVQGVLVHSDWLAEYGLKTDKALSRETLPIAERLRQVLELDSNPLDVQRSPDKRALATCRDYALMLCSFLRSKGTPARLRCGFASYLGGNVWEDHWVCEYLNARTSRWQLADAQMDDVLQDCCQVSFDSAYLPSGVFRTAGEIWLQCRAGSVDPMLCGHGDDVGLWFIAVNVVRDHLALNGRETSPWDSWRAARDFHKSRLNAELSRFDSLARHPEQGLTQVEPFWPIPVEPSN